MSEVSRVEGPGLIFFGGRASWYLVAPVPHILVRRKIRGQPAPGRMNHTAGLFLVISEVSTELFTGSSASSNRISGTRLSITSLQHE